MHIIQYIIIDHFNWFFDKKPLLVHNIHEEPMDVTDDSHRQDE